MRKFFRSWRADRLAAGMAARPHGGRIRRLNLDLLRLFPRDYYYLSASVGVSCSGGGSGRAATAATDPRRRPRQVLVAIAASLVPGLAREHLLLSRGVLPLSPTSCKDQWSTLDTNCDLSVTVTRTQFLQVSF